MSSGVSTTPPRETDPPTAGTSNSAYWSGSPVSYTSAIGLPPGTHTPFSSLVPGAQTVSSTSHMPVWGLKTVPVSHSGTSAQAFPSQYWSVPQAGTHSSPCSTVPGAHSAAGTHWLPSHTSPEGHMGTHSKPSCRVPGAQSTIKGTHSPPASTVPSPQVLPSSPQPGSTSRPASRTRHNLFIAASFVIS